MPVYYAFICGRYRKNITAENMIDMKTPKAKKKKKTLRRLFSVCNNANFV